MIVPSSIIRSSIFFLKFNCTTCRRCNIIIICFTREFYSYFWLIWGAIRVHMGGILSILYSDRFISRVVYPRRGSVHGIVYIGISHTHTTTTSIRHHGICCYCFPSKVIRSNKFLCTESIFSFYFRKWYWLSECRKKGWIWVCTCGTKWLKSSICILKSREKTKEYAKGKYIIFHKSKFIQ